MNNIDYKLLLPMALIKYFPDADQRKHIEETLNQYGSKSIHLEPDRVKIDIIYLVTTKSMEIGQLIEAATCDFRDVICAAEYPYTLNKISLKETNPKKYKAYEEKEFNEYMSWILKIQNV